jgi:hypothetical protein
MSPISVSVIAFVLFFGGALLGSFIGARLPKQHLSADNKDVVRLGMGLVGTIAGIALGLLIGSAYSYFNTQTDELVHASADVAALGRLLQRYGPDANAAHESVRIAVETVLDNGWPKNRTEGLKLSLRGGLVDDVYDQLRALAAKDDEHRMMKSEAIGLLKSLALLRWLIIEQSASTVLTPLLFVMIFWLTAIFVSWGLFATPNVITTTTFFVAALCVSGAIVLIMELYSPYGGLLRVSSAPLRLAYESLGY